MSDFLPLILIILYHLGVGFSNILLETWNLIRKDDQLGAWMVSLLWPAILAAMVLYFLTSRLPRAINRYFKD